MKGMSEKYTEIICLVLKQEPKNEIISERVEGISDFSGANNFSQYKRKKCIVVDKYNK